MITADGANLNSPARETLRTAIELLAGAKGELAEAQAPEQRLCYIVGQLEAAERNLAACRAEDDRILGAWLAKGAEGDRPQPNEKTLAAERAMGALGRDADVARSLLPEHQARVHACASRLGDLGIAREEAAYRAAVEVVRELLDTQYRPAIQGLLAIEAKARSVERALYELGNGANPSSAALTCAVEIGTAIRAVKAAAGIAPDYEIGKRLLDRLMKDAETTLDEGSPRDRRVQIGTS
jgi:hypothetical protein